MPEVKWAYMGFPGIKVGFGAPTLGIKANWDPYWEAHVFVNWHINPAKAGPRTVFRATL